MAKKKTQIPKYGTITLKGIQYYRTRITDADGKELILKKKFENLTIVLFNN